MSKKGYKQTEEHKKKIGLSNSVSLRGHKQSKESNEKRSISAKNRVLESGISVGAARKPPIGKVEKQV
jgi:hypothetical protein